MNRLTRWIYAHATPKYLILAIMCIIPFNALAFPLMSAHFRDLTGGLSTLDVQLGYLPADALRQVADFGAAGRSFYLLIEWTADLFFPLVYMALFSLLLAIILQGGTAPDHPLRKMALLPFFMMVADYCENILVSALLVTYPAAISALAWLAALASLLKWLFGGLIALALIVSLVTLVHRFLQDNRPGPDAG